MPVISGGQAQNRTEDTRIFSHLPRASRTPHQYISYGNDSISIFYILADFPRFCQFWKNFLTRVSHGRKPVHLISGLPSAHSFSCVMLDPRTVFKLPRLPGALNSPASKPHSGIEQGGPLLRFRYPALGIKVGECFIKLLLSSLGRYHLVGDKYSDWNSEDEAKNQTGPEHAISFLHECKLPER